MFARPARGLFDFLVAALCVWGAYYHTPAGAVLRRGTAWMIGAKSTAQPLLAYYGGSGGEPGWMNRTFRGPVVRGDLPPRLALAQGAWESFRQLPKKDRSAAYEAARRYRIDGRALEDEKDGAEQTARLLEHLKTDLGSDEAAVLALLCGYEPAHYALDRARAEGGELRMEQIARQLPPEFEERVGLAAQAMTLSTAFGLSWPVPESTPVTSGFGERDHPILGIKKLHTGVDLSIPIGSAVKSSAAGVVRRASEDAINGKVLVLDHGNGVTTAYCHNSSLLVRAGDRVERGQLIARSGSTGRSTGPHLHYQLELADHPVDPLRFRGAPRGAVVANGSASEGRPGRVGSPRPVRSASPDEVRVVPAVASPPQSPKGPQRPRPAPPAGVPDGGQRRAGSARGPR